MTKTYEQLLEEAKAVAVEVRKAYDMDTVMDILRQFAVKKITALDMNQLPEFIAACEEHLRDRADDVDPEAAAEPYAKMAESFEGVEYSSAPRAIGINPAIAAPYAEVDTANQQHASLADAKFTAGETVTHKSEGTHQLHNLPKADHRADHMSPYTIGLPGDLHPSTTVLVLDTANLMGQKLFNAQQKYGLTNGWQDTDWSNPKDGATFTGDHTCRQHAFGHILKGDPVDVANYMAFMMFHGWSCAPQSREEAQAWVELLQKKYDLLDDNAILRDLMEKMEERHGEEFNAFFEATISAIMEAMNLDELRVSTSAVIYNAAITSGLVCSEEPGALVYRRVTPADVIDQNEKVIIKGADVVIPDECVASGQSCEYAADGPNGEMQCKYCGKEQGDTYAN